MIRSSQIEKLFAFRVKVEDPRQFYRRFMTYFHACVLGYSKHQTEEKMRSSLLAQDYQTGWSFYMLAKKFVPKQDLIKINDRYVGKARVYQFTYQNGAKEDLVAVQCCEDPTMYIRLDDSTKTVRLLFFTSTANKLHNAVKPTESDL
jgi:hypothetical protein